MCKRLHITASWPHRAAAGEMECKMSLTIKDIAEKAGVSVATVSRVINGSGYVSEKNKYRGNYSGIELLSECGGQKPDHPGL